ncbi:MAG: hypothetical protein ABIG84_05025 [archaeon]
MSRAKPFDRPATPLQAPLQELMMVLSRPFRRFLNLHKEFEDIFDGPPKKDLMKGDVLILPSGLFLAMLKKQAPTPSET